MYMKMSQITWYASGFVLNIFMESIAVTLNYHRNNATEIKSIQLHDSIEGLSQMTCSVLAIV